MDYIVIGDDAKGLIIKKTHDLTEAEKVAEEHTAPSEIYRRERLGKPYIFMKKVEPKLKKGKKDG